ncbi:MAG: LTA synthase family protein [Candidatus Egerieousia sp.]|nr:LTA synthase family protein [Candidatus Egerieousia sp.]
MLGLFKRLSKGVRFSNYYLLIIWRLLLAYIIYSLCRAVFLIYNLDLLQPMSGADLWNIFRGGLMFDTTAILYTNILYLVLSFIPAPFVFNRIYQKILRILYVTVNFICVCMNLGDTVYFPFSMRRVSMTFFSEFTGDINFGTILLESLAMFWYITLIGIILLLLLICLSGSCKHIKSPAYAARTAGPATTATAATTAGAATTATTATTATAASALSLPQRRRAMWRAIGLQALALIITAPLFIIGVRGGATRTMRPITLSNAGDFVQVAIHTQAVLNTPFSIIRTIGKAKFTKQNFYPTEAALEQVFTPIKNFPDGATAQTLQANGTAASASIRTKEGPALQDSHFVPALQLEEGATVGSKRNIVILIVESFAAENMSFLNPELPESLTPFLDSLSREGLLCTNAFANGRKSIDAVPSILASMPSLITSFAVTPYATNDLNGLPDILKEMGYYCAFLHGAPNNSMGIRAVSHLCGVDNYYGKTEFGDDSKFDGAWGIWDEYFLPFAANTIGTFKEPFCASIFTLSSHHPFKLPKEYEGVFPQGETDLQRVTPYTDMSLRKFFAQARKSDWYKNTIFVITPDHSTLTGHAPKYKTPIWSTSIPIIFYAPGFIKPGRYNAPVQQLDIMPTLLGLLNYNKPYFAFGRDLNRDSTLQPFVINYGTNQFQLIQGDTLLVRDNKSLVAAYYYKTDSLLLNNLLAPAGGAAAGSTQVSTAVGTAGSAAVSSAVSTASAGAAAGSSAAVSSAVNTAGSALAAGAAAGANTDPDYEIILNAPQIQDKELLAKQNAFFKAIIQQYVNRMIDNRLTPAN